MAAIRAVLKWKNKYSGEEGYVKTMAHSKGHFVNTYEQSEAKIYTSDKVVAKDLEALKEMGETENNDFYTVPV